MNIPKKYYFIVEMSASFLKNSWILNRRILFSSKAQQQQQGSKNFSSFPALCQLPRVSVAIADSVTEQFNSPEFKARKHPGAQSVGNVCLPMQFSDAAKLILKREGFSTLKNQAEKLDNYLHNRRLPIERKDFMLLASKLEDQVRSQTSILERFLSEKELVTLEQQRQEKVKLQMRRQVYNWEPIQYGEQEALQYLICRTAAEYAALYKIFSEISRRDPDFEPTSLLDFGSGLNSVLWAANAFWNKSLKEQMCVDSSREMNDLSEMILRGCNRDKPLIFPNTFHRQFLPESQNIHYDLVTSAYSLMELSSIKERIHVLNTLWRKCTKYIVIVERGTKAGFQLVNEARNFILRLDRETDRGTEGHVFSPCPHDTFCPRVLDNPDRPCNFGVTYRELVPFHKERIGAETFSYVVIKKESRNPDAEVWPRILEQPMTRHDFVICRLCMPEGKLSEVMVQKSKYPRSLYRCARKSRWGELLPIKEATSVSDVDLETMEGSNNDDNGLAEGDDDESDSSHTK